MDPWLEGPAIFPDLHNTLITYLGDALNASLPEPYFARSATRVWVEDQRREPDVGVFDPATRPKSGGVDVAAALTDAGMIAVVESDTTEFFEESYLEIRSSGDDRLVSAIEVLSLSNKTPGDKGRAAYLQKQSEILKSGVGLVEIDLLRGGLHTTAVSPAKLRAKAGLFAYHVSIAAAELGPQKFAAPIKLADRLPPIPIPLDEAVTPVRVELQPLLDRCYDNRRYGRQVRYDRPPDPPLTPEQQAWADAVLREKGFLK
jgi:hypothetical protein